MNIVEPIQHKPLGLPALPWRRHSDIENLIVCAQGVGTIPTRLTRSGPSHCTCFDFCAKLTSLGSDGGARLLLVWLAVTSGEDDGRPERGEEEGWKLHGVEESLKIMCSRCGKLKVACGEGEDNEGQGACTHTIILDIEALLKCRGGVARVALF